MRCEALSEEIEMEGEGEQVKAHSGEKHWEKLSVYAIKVFSIHPKEMK